ncbi:hypothetical protein [Arthrobacter sp. HLT1-21]
MNTSATPTEDFSWLPEALEPVALRLARADQCAYRVGDLTSQWSLDGPLGMEQVRRGDNVQMFLKSIRPVPPEVLLLFSEAVNHLRASIDNVVWYLIEQEHGQLNGSAGTLVSMPILESQEAFERWTSRRVKEKISAFGADTSLGRRLHTLQPFSDVQSAVPSTGQVLANLMRLKVETAHPLRLLQAYSNGDKHRSIRVAVPRTFSSTDATPLVEQDLAHQELRVGDALGPPTRWGQMSVLETNTAMMVQRPEPFSAWVNPVKELCAMRRHASRVVIPVLLTGLEMPRSLPAAVELGDNGQSTRERLIAGVWEDADARLAGIMRDRFHEAEHREIAIPPVVEDLNPHST